MIAAVLTDIEGTTTPVAFVQQVLFPFARARLEGFLATQHEAAAAVPAPKLETLRGWMDSDAKIPVLKTIQGLIWDEGYRSGALRGALYADVPVALRRWAAAGVALYVYSSGSVAAQKLLFGFSQAGDLAPLFRGFFDTAEGPKRAAASYAAIARAAAVSPPALLFLSDVEAELDAAAAAGLRTCQLVREADGTQAGARHETAADFAVVGTKFGLPGG